MKREQVISDEVLKIIQAAIYRGENWMAYNRSLYFIDKDDLSFFKDREQANEYASSNYSDHEQYNVTHVQSLADVYRQIHYGENLSRQLENPDANNLFNTEGNAFTDALIEHMEQQQILNNKKVSTMNEKNFEYLKDNIKYMGFGEKQHDALEQHLNEGKESFQMKFTAEVNKKPFEALLQFRRPDNSDMYFFNSYKASLERSNGEKVDQTFYLNKGKGVTAKEAYNLLEGRSVFKELTNKAGESYKAWMQLDFDNKDKNQNYEVKQYHENYGYDLKAAVSKFGVAELDGGEKEKALMQSLQKGNLQSVSLDVNGESQKMFIEANPQYKTVNLYNDKMQPVTQQQRQELAEKQSVKMNGTSVNEDVKQSVKLNGTSVNEDVKQSVKPENKKSLKINDGVEGSKKKPTRRKRMSG